MACHAPKKQLLDHGLPALAYNDQIRCELLLFGKNHASRITHFNHIGDSPAIATEVMDQTRDLLHGILLFCFAVVADTHIRRIGYPECPFEGNALGAFYLRLAGRIGNAVTATARKIAVLFYNAMRFGMEYKDPGANHYEQHYRERVLKQLHRRAAQFGFMIGLVTATAVAFIPATGAQSAEQGAKPSTQAFLKNAAEMCHAEMTLGQLAADRGTNKRVREFGSQIKEDHKRISEGVQLLASRHDVKLPSEPSDEHKQKIRELSSLSGHAFCAGHTRPCRG